MGWLRRWGPRQHGLILAAEELSKPGGGKANGQFYVITDGGAQPFWRVLDDAVVACGFISLWSKVSAGTSSSSRDCRHHSLCGDCAAAAD